MSVVEAPAWVVDGLLVARLLLATVLSVAALAKLRHRTPLDTLLRALGLPASWGAPLAVLVPAVELMVAALLLPGRTLYAGLVVAALLLAAFTAVVAALLARGARVACGCFGAMSAEVVGPRTLVRNVALLLLALLLLALGGGPAPLAWWRTLTADGQRVAAVLGAVLTGLGVLGGVVLAQHRRLQRLEQRVERLHRLFGPLDGHSVGAPAPRFALPTRAGGERTLNELLAPGRPVALVFLSPGCDHCALVAQELPGLLTRVSLAVLTRPGEDGLPGVPPDRVLLQDAFEVGERFRLESVPAVVVVAPGPVVASLPVTGASAVTALLRELATGGGVPEWARVRSPG